jgi:hypothetical protein
MRVVTQSILFGTLVATGANADTFQWQLGNPSCPTACGKLSTIVQRPLSCVKISYGVPVVVGSSYCDPYNKPNCAYTCPATPPCAPHWYTSPVMCPTNCGCAASTLPRNVLCEGTINGAVVVIADSYCTATKPYPFVYCNATAECVTYHWKLGNESCPTQCGKAAQTIYHSLSCLAISNSHPLGVSVNQQYCMSQSKPSTALICQATPPCAPICAANEQSCTCDADCCSGICEFENDTPSKSSKNTPKSKESPDSKSKGKLRKATKGTKTKSTKSTKTTKYTKNTKNTKNTPSHGTCACLQSAASCTKNAQCCSNLCKNYRCASSGYLRALDPLRQGNAGSAGSAVALGIGAGVGLAAVVAVGVARRQRRLAKMEANPQVDFVVA